jgi:disulfide bond formation protein DsbB
MMCSALVMGAALLAACGGGAPAPAATSAAPAGPKVSAEGQKYVALKGDPAAGKTKFLGTCVSCHGPDAKGLPNLGKNLTTSAFLKGLADADAVLFLTKGRPSSDPANTTKVDMPPRGGNPALKDQDLADIIAFIRTLQK